MLHSYLSEDGKITEFDQCVENALWYDLSHPTENEKKEFQEKLHLSIPTHKKRKYGLTNRFYKTDHSIFMTASIVTKTASDHPSLSPVTFIVNTRCLATIREAEFTPFQIFRASLLKGEEPVNTPVEIFLNILEAIVNRLAEVTDKIVFDIDALSKETFQMQASSRSRKLSDNLTTLGKKGDLTAKINESLQSLGRLVNYFNFQTTLTNQEQPLAQSIKILQEDLKAIEHYLIFLAHKINFLLDATLGYISIEQNGITKTFTTLAAVFLPPMLIASIYGMNFQMPELRWSLGYPFALILIIASAIFPFLYFKRKNWL